MLAVPALFRDALKKANILITLATPLAIRPKPIKNTGPITPAMAVRPTTNPFAPSSSSLNFLRMLVPNSSSGVTAFRNASPSGTRVTLMSSIAFWNLNIGESSILFISRSDSTASSSVVALVSFRTRLAWLPSLITFWNNVDRRENWNFPNSCSIARARLSGSKPSRAVAKSKTSPFTSPAFDSTIPLMLIPNPWSISEACLVGLMRAARPDLSALAPSEAFMPPSRIAVRKKVRSSTSPPSC